MLENRVAPILRYSTCDIPSSCIAYQSGVISIEVTLHVQQQFLEFAGS